MKAGHTGERASITIRIPKSLMAAPLLILMPPIKVFIRVTVKGLTVGGAATAALVITPPVLIVAVLFIAAIKPEPQPATLMCGFTVLGDRRGNT